MAPKKEFDKTISLEFVKEELKSLDNGDVFACYGIKKPSDLPSVYQPSVLPKVRLDLKEEGNNYLLDMMLKMNHRNILRLEAIQEIPGENLLRVFVEPHHGPLIAYLEKLVADKTTRVIPSQTFRDLVRQMVDAIEELRINRLYHGAVSVENIYYSIDSHVVIIKLANFVHLPDTDPEDAQLGDWVGLGRVLDYISNAARLSNNSFSCAMINRLASKLQGLTDTALLPNLKEIILSELFFWDTRKRTNFYIHDIAEALDNDVFCQRVRNYMNWQLPWNSDPHDGLIAAMNEYREKELDKKSYNRMDPVDNVRCMSGAYTHQDQLKGKIKDSHGVLLSVDAAIQKGQPDLCLTLYRLLKGEIEAEAAAAAALGEAAAPVDAPMNVD